MNIGLIGCGGMGQALGGAAAGIEGTKIVAVCDAVPKTTASAAAKFDADAVEDASQLMLRDDIDGVLIAAPPFEHADLCIDAARAGKHVFVEKPMATTVEACDAMAAAAEDADICLMVGHVCRFHEVHATVRQLVHDGAIGDSILISVHRLGGGWGGPYNQRWRMQRELSGGTLMEINAHEIDFMRWVCGEVATVSAVGGTFLQHEADYPDLVLATLHFESGALGLLHASQVTALGAYGGRIDGTLGSMHFPALFGKSRDISFKRLDDAPCPRDLAASQDRDPVRDEIQSWIRAIQEGTEPPVTGRDGRMTVAIAEAAYASLDAGHPVTPR